MKDSDLLNINFSKIRLKFDNKEIDLQLLALVLSSALKIGMILAIFSFLG